MKLHHERRHTEDSNEERIEEYNPRFPAAIPSTSGLAEGALSPAVSLGALNEDQELDDLERRNFAQVGGSNGRSLGC